MLGGGEGGCGYGWERSRQVKEFSYEKVVTARPGVGDTTTFTCDPPIYLSTNMSDISCQDIWIRLDRAPRDPLFSTYMTSCPSTERSSAYFDVYYLVVCKSPTS